MDPKLLELTAGIVASFVEHNNVASNDLPDVIRSVHSALAGLGAPEAPADDTVRLSPAAIKKSITPDFLVSFIDGKRYKTLKRHLATHDLTFADYKAKFGLPKDYPSTSPNYSAQRSALAKQLGLGQGGRGSAPKAAPEAAKVGKTSVEPAKGKRGAKVSNKVGNG